MDELVPRGRSGRPCLDFFLAYYLAGGLSYVFCRAVNDFLCRSSGFTVGSRG